MSQALARAFLADAAKLDYGAHVGIARAAPRLAQRARQLVVIDVRGLPAIVADQEDAVVPTAGMSVGELGVGALDPVGEVRAHE